MVGYILITIGAWLLYDDYKIAKAKKSKGGQDGIHENGNDRNSGDSAGKPRSIHKKSDRDGRISPIPVKSRLQRDASEERGVNNGVFKKPVHKVEPDQNSDSTGNNSSGQSDGVAISNQGESVKRQKSEVRSQKSEKKGGARIIPGSKGQDAKHKINHENGAGNDGNNVRTKSDSGHEPDSAEVD